MLLLSLLLIPRTVAVQGSPSVRREEYHLIQSAHAEIEQKLQVYKIHRKTDRDVIEYIHKYFDEDDVAEAITTAKCESHLIPQQSMIIKNGVKENSWGVWQIHLSAHTNITKEQAMDIEWSTRWAAEQFRKGNKHIWTCYRNLFGK